MNFAGTAHLSSIGRLSGTNELDSNPKFTNDPHSVTQTIKFSTHNHDFKGDGAQLKSLFTK